MKTSVALSILLAGLTHLAPANAAEFGRQKVAQWGDPLTPPHTRTRCIGYASGTWPWGGGWKTCNQWATDTRTMQVYVWSKSLGPDNLNAVAAAAVESTAKVCAGSAGIAAAGAIAGTPSPEVAARLAAGYAAATAAFSACVGAKASSLASVGVATAALKLAFDQTSGWSKWSNE